MAETPIRTRTEWAALADAALETAVTTVMNTTIERNPAPSGHSYMRVTRNETLKLLAQRALRKTTQPGMRREMKISPPGAPGPND